MAASGHSLFLYGTLMNQRLLHQVCCGCVGAPRALCRSTHLETCDAILGGYRRHRVRRALYPAIVSCVDAEVRGVLVTGFTQRDIQLLDDFEGHQYTRTEVKPRKVLVANALGKCVHESKDEIVCHAYVWSANPKDLAKRDWSLADFKRWQEIRASHATSVTDRRKGEKIAGKGKIRRMSTAGRSTRRHGQNG